MADRVLVVGAGVVGLLTALELSQRGTEVTLVEASGVAAGVSGGSLAALTNHLAGEPEDLPFVMSSTRRWEDIAGLLLEETGIDVEYEVAGQMSLVEGRNESDAAESLRYVKDMVKRERAQGLEVELIGPDAARERIPGLAGSRLVGATWCPGDAKINALLACRALADLLVARGVELHQDWAAAEFLPDGQGWVVRNTRGEKVRVDAFTVAAGPWSGPLLAGIEPALLDRIWPKRAQCCVTEKLPRMIGPVVASISVGISTGYTQLHQTRSGQVMFNTVTETEDPRRSDGSLEDKVDHDFLVASSRTLVDLFPATRSARLLRAWSACEAWTADQRFLVGAVGDHPGAYIAAGDSGVGFLKAPMVARSVADLMHEIDPPHSLERYAPLRGVAGAQV